MKLYSLFLFTFSVFACEITTHSKIVVLKEKSVLNTKELIRTSNCSAKTNQDFVKALISREGKILTSNLISNVKVTPQITEIHDLNSLVNKHLSSDIERLFFESRYIGNEKLLIFESTDKVLFSCENCHKLGSQNIRMDVHGRNSKSYWLTSRLKARRKVFTSINQITAFSKEDLSKLVQESFVYTDKSANYVENKNVLRFYKPNKKIEKDAAITYQDLSPVKLINRNQRVEVTIRTGEVAIKTTAISRQSGNIGDFIELINPKTKKIILAKIIDFNKVEVGI